MTVSGFCLISFIKSLVYCYIIMRNTRFGTVGSFIKVFGLDSKKVKGKFPGGVSLEDILNSPLLITKYTITNSFEYGVVILGAGDNQEVYRFAEKFPSRFHIFGKFKYKPPYLKFYKEKDGDIRSLAFVRRLEEQAFSIVVEELERDKIIDISVTVRMNSGSVDIDILSYSGELNLNSDFYDRSRDRILKELREIKAVVYTKKK